MQRQDTRKEKENKQEREAKVSAREGYKAVPVTGRGGL
jgi:hypothetical protein